MFVPFSENSLDPDREKHKADTSAKHGCKTIQVIDHCMIPPDVFTVVEVKVEPYFDLRKIGDKNGNSQRKWHLCFCFYRTYYNRCFSVVF